jgi:hypothetical protein
MKQDFKIKLGDVVQDKVTGYVGVVICQARWLYGCKRYTVQSPVLKDGVPVANICADEDSLTVHKAVKIKSPVRSGGGPTLAVSRGQTVSR